MCNICVCVYVCVCARITIVKIWAMTAAILLVIIMCMQVVMRTPCVKSVVYARILFAYLRAASENCC